MQGVMSMMDEPLRVVSRLPSDAHEPVSSGSSDLYSTTARSYDRVAEEYARAHAGIDEVEDILIAFSSALSARSTILDSGCGHGRDASFFTADGHRVIGLDYSAGLLRIASRTAPDAVFLAADVRALPVRNAVFDAVWMNAVIHHLLPEDVAGALRELARVLRAGGLVYASTHFNRVAGWDRKYPDAPRYYSGLTKTELLAALRHTGFSVEKTFNRQGEDSWLHIFARMTKPC